MKILQINNHHRIAGGAHMVYFRTADLLKKNGHEVYFFSLKEDETHDYEYSKFFPRAIDFRKLGAFQKLSSARQFVYNKDAYEKLNAYIEEVKPDIAHIHLFMGGLTVSILDALKKNKVPIVHSVHDYRLICPAYTFYDRNNKVCERCRDGFFLRCGLRRCSLDNKFTESSMLSIDAYYRKYFNNSIKNIDKFIFVSSFSKNLHASFSLKYHEKGIKLYNFLPAEKVQTTKKGDYYLFYGRLSREKGIVNLIKVFQKLDSRLVIAGSGPLEDYVKSKQDKNISFVGFKTGNDLKKLISNSSFVIVPSEWYENNPLTIVESFSFGKPVIGSSIGGITELLENGKGILFKAGKEFSLEQAILKANSLIGKEYSNMSLEVSRFAQQEFSEGLHYNELINIYNSTL